MTAFGRDTTLGLLAALGVAADPPAVDRIHAATRGNAAAIRAAAALLSSAESDSDALALLPQSPSLEALVDRVRRRLSDEELLIMDELAVFGQAAPADHWRDAAAPFARLVERGLLDMHDGLVELEPHIRGIVYQRMRPDARPLLHLRAARALEARGDYAGAARHFVEGGDEAAALRLWSAHADAEIERGAGAAALSLLSRIRPDQLPDDEHRNLLRFAVASLLKLFGRTAEAEAELSRVSPDIRGLPRAYWLALRAEVEAMQGRYAQAAEGYDAAIRALVRAPEKRLVELHARRAHLLQYRLNDLPAARRDVLLARIEAESFAGEYENRVGNLSRADAHYAVALALASEVEGELERKTWVYARLAELRRKQGRLDEARDFAALGLAICRARGDPLGESSGLMTLAAIELVDRHPDRALEQSQAGLELAQRLGHTFFAAGHASNAAEALYYLGRDAEALEMANRSLEAEEEWFRIFPLLVIGWVRARQGNLAAAERAFEEAIQGARDLEDPMSEAPAWRALADVQARQGRTDEARAAYARALDLCRQLGQAQDVVELERAVSSLAS